MLLSLDINIGVWFLCVGLFIYIIMYPKKRMYGIFIALCIVTYCLYKSCIKPKIEGFIYDKELYKKTLQKMYEDNDVKDLRKNHIKPEVYFDRVFNDIVELLYQTDAVNRIDTTQDKWLDKVSWDSSIGNMKEMVYKVKNRKNDSDQYGTLLKAGAQDNDVKHFRDDVTDLLNANTDRNRVADRVITLMEHMAARSFIIVRFLSANNTNKLKALDSIPNTPLCNGIAKPITCPICDEQPFCTSTGWACPSMWTKELPIPEVNDQCLG